LEAREASSGLAEADLKALIALFFNLRRESSPKKSEKKRIREGRS